jgi:predicted transposase/invertase (TIGR01784 family)
MMPAMKSRKERSMQLVKATVDVAFQRMMGSAGNEAVLLDFLNAVLRSSGDGLATAVELATPHLVARAIRDKGAVLDIRATLADGRMVNVEMQAVNEQDWQRRNLYYWARLYGEQLKAGRSYLELRPVVSVAVLDFRLWPGDYFHSTFRLRADHDSGLLWNDHLALHTLELPKELAAAPGQDEALVRWMRFLRNGPDEAKEEMARESPAMQQALSTLRTMSHDEDFRRLYEAREKFQRDLLSARELSERRGREKGRAEGRAEGRMEGRVEGRAEGRNEIVAKLLASGMTPGEVADRTGLPIEEVTRVMGRP